MIDAEVVRAQLRASVAINALQESELTESQLFALATLVNALTLLSQRLCDVDQAERSTKH